MAALVDLDQAGEVALVDPDQVGEVALVDPDQVGEVAQVGGVLDLGGLQDGDQAGLVGVQASAVSVVLGMVCVVFYLHAFTFCAVASCCKSAVDHGLDRQGLGAHLALEAPVPSEMILVFGYEISTQHYYVCNNMKWSG